MQALDIFLSRLIPTVPGCPDPLARQALIDAAISFCEATHIIRATSDPQAANEGVSTYEVETPSAQRVCLVLRAWYGPTELAPAGEAMLNDVRAFTPFATGASAQLGTPTHFYEVAPGEVAVYPLPSKTEARMLTFRVALKPDRTAKTLEDVLAQDWMEAIVYGARAKLHAVPGLYFTSQPVAEYCEQQFRKAVGKARSESLVGRTRAQLQISMHPFI